MATSLTYITRNMNIDGVHPTDFGALRLPDDTFYINDPSKYSMMDVDLHSVATLNSTDNQYYYTTPYWFEVNSIPTAMPPEVNQFTVIFDGLKLPANIGIKFSMIHGNGAAGTPPVQMPSTIWSNQVIGGTGLALTAAYNNNGGGPSHAGAGYVPLILNGYSVANMAYSGSIHFHRVSVANGEWDWNCTFRIANTNGADGGYGRGHTGFGSFTYVTTQRQPPVFRIATHGGSSQNFSAGSKMSILYT